MEAGNIPWMHTNELTGKIIGAAIEVHKYLGPGLLESAYETALMREFYLREIHAENQVYLPLEYKGKKCVPGYRIDVLVEGKIILELKSVSTLCDIHMAQIISYLKLADKRLGFLINFNVKMLKTGIKRVVNNYNDGGK